MKKVFTNSEICHVFNQQTQYEGRTSNSNLYFYNNKLYSYGSHYLLCEFIDENTVIINDKGYSNSTAKHIGLITSATRNKQQFFVTEITTNIVLSNVNEWLKKLVRSRKYKSFYINSINSTLVNYFKYLEYTKQLTKYKQYKEHRKIILLYKQFKDNLPNLEQSVIEANKLEQQRNKEAIKVNLKLWKQLKINWFKNNTKTDFLRLNNDIVETSQGIKVSVVDAKKLLRLIDAKKIIGTKVNDIYTVTAFNGFLKAGCHSIPLTEINYIKNLIN